MHDDSVSSNQEIDPIGVTTMDNILKKQIASQLQLSQYQHQHRMQSHMSSIILFFLDCYSYSMNKMVQYMDSLAEQFG